MTEVGALAGGLAWRCATLAMLASMLCRFIWPIAMVTEAGARLAGIRGCDIIMKGNCSRTGAEQNEKRRKRREYVGQFLSLSQTRPGHHGCAASFIFPSAVFTHRISKGLPLFSPMFTELKTHSISHGKSESGHRCRSSLLYYLDDCSASKSQFENMYGKRWARI